MNYKSVFGLLLTYGLMAATEAAAAAPIWGRSPIAEPYPYVSSGSFSGPAVAASPDPLVRYRWPNPKASDGLEIYLRRPESATSDPTSSFANVNSLLTPTPNVTVSGKGTIRVDFGRENAGWFEIDSPDCPGGIQMSISEYNEPEYTNIGDKTITPEKVGNTYRAKFNNEYYEGVRFGFIHVNSCHSSLAYHGHPAGLPGQAGQLRRPFPVQRSDADENLVQFRLLREALQSERVYHADPDRAVGPIPVEWDGFLSLQHGQHGRVEELRFREAADHQSQYAAGNQLRHTRATNSTTC